MDNPDGWVFRVGVNHLKRRARRRTIETALLRKHRDPAAVLPGPTGEIWALVAELSPRQRQAIALRHLGQLTEPEIASVMGVNRGTVSSTLRAAYQHLRTTITEDAPEHATEPDHAQP